MRRQHARLRVSQPGRQFLVRDLARDMVGQEGREYAITGLEARYLGANLCDGAAHIGAGDFVFEGGGVRGGFVVGIFAFCYYH